MNLLLLGTTVTFAGVTYRVDVQWGIVRHHEDDPWSLFTMDVTTVVDVLRAVAEGKGTAAEALTAVEAGLGALIARSGCCPHCESQIDKYAQALARYAADMKADQERAVGMTGETHPFSVTVSGAIHMFDCRHRGDVSIPHPGRTLQEYVHGVPDADWPLHEPGQYRGREPYARRMTPEELVPWLRSRLGPKGGELFRRCKVCQPALPVAYMSEACDVE